MFGADATTNNRRAILVLACVCVVLAAVIAGILVDRFGGAPSSTATTVSGTSAETSETVVPSGETPEQFATTYFDAILDGDYVAAYDRLPADKKTEQTLDEFAASIESYGITGYTVDGVDEAGTQMKVLITATMTGGSMQYLWTFTKDGDSWVLTSRELGGYSE